MNILAGAAAAALEAASMVEQVRSAEQRYRSLSETAADVIIRYELHPHVHISYVNPAFTALMGYSPEEYYADPGLILKIVHPDDRPLKEAVLRGNFVSGSVVTLRWVSRKGNTVWIEQRNSAVMDAEGQMIAIEGIGRDITERRQLEEQLRHSQKMEALGLLAGGVAHDFNNMLTVIIGYSELILSDESPADGVVEKLDQVKKAAEHAAELTRKLLAFGRQQILRPRMLDVNTIVENNLEMLRRTIGEDIELVTILDARLASVLTDASQMEQILMNLVVNAKQAMPLGGTIAIETRNVTLAEHCEAGTPPTHPGPFVMLAVSDTGCGMTDALMGRIFEPFYTTKELGKGTGLGLSIVYGIVKQSGGGIRVISKPDEGARFEILLPRSEELKRNPDPSEGSVVSIGTETIMVVEDELELGKLIGMMLQHAGYEVLTARSGKEALLINAQHEGRIALILTDMIMPGMSGPSLVKLLVSLHPGVKVLYMSGYARDVIASDRGLDPEILFIQKPFNAKTLTSKVREILDGADEATSIAGAGY